MVFRLIYLAPARNAEPILTSITPNIFTVIVAHFSIMACCVTSLKPFLHAFNQPSYEYKTSGTAHSGRSGLHDNYYKLESWKKIERSDGSASGSGNHPGSWRPNLDSTAAGHATAYPAKAHTRGRDNIITPEKALNGKKWTSRKEVRGDADSAETDASDRLIIQRTTEVSVQYEDEHGQSRP